VAVLAYHGLILLPLTAVGEYGRVSWLYFRRRRLRKPSRLHTEIMRQHLLAVEGPGGTWRLSGLVDFEPAMRGDHEYEFVGVGVFVAEGDAPLLTRTLTSYGYGRDQLGPELRRRLLAWGILHRYSNLRWWMRRLPEPSQPTLAVLADCWFATEQWASNAATQRRL
jgi:hygromycin-B 7''-O-kinase